MLKEFPVGADDARRSFKPGDVVGVDTFARRPAGRRDRHDQGPRLLGRDPPPQLQLEPRVARQLAFAQHARARSRWRRIRAACSRASAWPGQYGNVTRTVQTLKVVRVDAERGLLLVKGAVPGADGGAVIVRPVGQDAGEEGGVTMELKLINDSGSRRDGRGLRRAVRPRLQRGADPPGRHRLPGERPAGHARAEGAQRDQQVAQEAVEAEGHRPRPRGPGQQPAVARRRQDLPELARRELHAEGQPQDVPRRDRVDPVAARARGPPHGGRGVRGGRAEDQAVRAEDEGDGPRPARCWSSPTSSTRTCSSRRATCRTCWCSRPREVDPVSLVRFENVLLTKAAVGQFEEMLG